MTQSIDNQNRRLFLASSGLMALAVTPGLVGAASASGGHEHHSGKYTDLIEEALHCIETGNACAAHCIVDMRSGNTELLECLVQVKDLVAACQALVHFASYDSEHLMAYAKATIEVCDSCEAECRKFENKHDECKACADACAACAEECKKILS